MFSFALITGVKHGWLDAATYGPAARKSWIAVVGYIDQNHDVTQVCTGTGRWTTCSTTWIASARRETCMARRPFCGPQLPCCATRNDLPP